MHSRSRQPFKGQPSIDPLTVENDVGKDNAVSACFRAIFALAKFVSKLGDHWGILAHRHIAWHFFEHPDLPHHIRPNGHLLVVCDEPITFKTGKVMLETFTLLYQRREYGGALYTDMHISPLVSQAEIKRWIYYIFKPMNFARPYVEAIRRGVSVEALNHEVDDRVFQGGNSILSVPSPMRYGVLNVNSGKIRYLGGKSVTQQRNEAEEARKAAKEKRKNGTSAPRQQDSYIERHARHEQFLQDEGSY